MIETANPLLQQPWLSPNVRLQPNWAELRQRLRSRTDSEHGQALVRLALGSLLSLYLVAVLIASGRPVSFASAPSLWVGATFVPFSLSILAAILIHPQQAPVRRVVGMVADLGAASVLFALQEEWGLVFYVVLLWVIFGNGIRYGRRYLLIAAAIATVTFLAAVCWSPFWRQQTGHVTALLIGLLVLPAYVSVLIRTITEARAKAEEASRAKSQFLANMSHEVRTPLNGILGMVDLLRQTALTAEQEAFVRTLHHSASTLTSLVGAVLELSKIEAGQLAPKREEFDLYAVLRDTAELFKAQAKNRGIELRLRVHPDVPFRIVGDPLYLGQVLMNLIGNAIKFTNQGNVSVAVRLVSMADRTATIRFEVTDTGIGIAEDQLPRIFERFYQTGQQATEGAGLGTAIAKELVELMDGHIAARSQEGQGSTFWFDLPFEMAIVGTDLTSPHGATEASAVLIAGSRASCIERLGGYLRGWDAAVRTATNSAQTFTHLITAASTNQPYAAVILIEEGFDLSAQAFASAVAADEALASVPLILVTENAPADSRSYASVLRPPVEKPQLFNALHLVTAEQTTEDIVSLADHYVEQAAQRRSLRILLAEDNPTNQLVTRKILQRAGHFVHIVGDGEAALEALDSQHFDLALLDLGMPDVDGIEVAETYRFTRRSAPQVPLVALTANALPETHRRCKEAGMRAFLTKPVDAALLLNTVDSVVPEAADLQRQTPAPEAAAPPSSAQDVGAVLDPHVLSDLTALDPSGAFLASLIPVFLDDARQHLSDLESAEKARQAEPAQRILASLETASASLGLAELVTLCGEIAHGYESSWDEGAQLRGRLPQALTRAEGELLRYRGQGAAAGHSINF